MTETELLTLFAPRTAPTLPTDIEVRIADYVAHLNTLKPEYSRFELVPNPRGKYRRIVSLHGGSGGSVHAFVDAEGNVYFPAGWKGPVKDGGRYHLANDTHYQLLTHLNSACWSGGYLYKDGLLR